MKKGCMKMQPFFINQQTVIIVYFKADIDGDIDDDRFEKESMHMSFYRNFSFFLMLLYCKNDRDAKADF